MFKETEPDQINQEEKKLPSKEEEGQISDQELMAIAKNLEEEGLNNAEIIDYFTENHPGTAAARWVKLLKEKRSDNQNL